MTQKCVVNYFFCIIGTHVMFTTNGFFFSSLTLLPPWSLQYPPQHVLVRMTDALDNKHRRDRGWLSFKTCSSTSEVQDVLEEMCNVSMLTRLDWISDGQKVITDRHGVTVGMEKMFKYPYHKQSECPFRLRVLQTAVHGSVSYTSESWQFDIQYTSNMPHAPHVDTDTGECTQF